MRRSRAAAAGVALMLLCAAAVARAGGVIYLVGGQAGGARAAASGEQDGSGRAHGVVLSGARLASASAARAGRSPPPRAAACADCHYATVAPIIDAVSRAANVDPALVAAVIDVESGFDRHALSSAGARGLMQLMPATALRFGVSDPDDPVQNVTAGALYLGQLVRRFAGNLRYALAAYNAGLARVRDYGGVPPFAETRAYVPRVLARYAAFRARFAAAGDLREAPGADDARASRTPSPMALAGTAALDARARAGQHAVWISTGTGGGD